MEYRQCALNMAHPGGWSRMAHPGGWSCDDVSRWLTWCVDEYGLSSDLPGRFLMNGKGLCMLTKEDCRQRAPLDGDVIYNTLTVLINNVARDDDGGVASSPTSAKRTHDWTLPSPSPPQNDVISPSWLSAVKQQDEPVNLSMMTSQPASCWQYPLTVASTQLLPPDYICQRGISSPPAADNSPVNKTTNSGCRLLWEFLAEMLVSSSDSDVIRWEDESSLKFRVIDPQRLAERWGQEKGKAGMTYEKLSRALRYYYKTQIVAKVRGQRLTYRFLTPPSCIKRGIRGAKPGVPHKRRQRPDTTTSTTSSAASSIIVSAQSCITTSPTDAMPFFSSLAHPALPSPPPSASISRPCVNEFSIDHLMMSTASRASSTSSSSSSSSPVDTCEMTSSGDVKIPILPPSLSMSHGLFVDGVAC